MCTGAACASDAMNEVFGLFRQIVVHDVRNVIDVNPARRHVGGDQYAANTILEALQRFVPLLLCAVAVDRGHLVSPSFQKFRKPVGALFGSHEHRGKNPSRSSADASRRSNFEPSATS